MQSAQTAKQAQPSIESFLLLIRKAIFPLVSNPDDVDDLVQEAAINLWSKRHIFDQLGPRLPSYAYRTGRHVAVNYLRKLEVQRKYRAMFVGLDISGSTTESSDPALAVTVPTTSDPEISDPYMRALLDSVLSKLPADKHHALLMLAGGATYDQIASAQGVGVNTIRSRIHYARQYARRALAPHLS